MALCKRSEVDSWLKHVLGEDIPEKGVAVGNLWRLEVRLGLRVVAECWSGGHDCGKCWGLVLCHQVG